MKWLHRLEHIFRIEMLLLLTWIVIFAIHAGAPISDPDTPWHLATGNYILAHHRIPTTDPFSWSMYGKPWVTQEWLFEVILAWLAQKVGFFGVWALAVFLHTVTVLVLYQLCCDVSDGQRVFSAIAASLGTAAGLAFWVLRPQLFSYLMFALFLWILARVNRGHLKALWAVPPLILIWANAHASVSIGIIMLVFEVILSFIPTVGRLSRLPLSNRARVYLLVTALVSIGIGLLNPNTYHEFTYALLSNNSLMVNSINEWHSPDFHSQYYKYGVIPFVAFVLVLLVIRKQHVPLKYVLYFGGCFALTLVYQRFMPYLAISGAPLLAASMRDWLRALLNPSRVFRYVLGILMCGVIVDFCISVPDLRGSVDRHFATNAYPIDCVNYLKQHPVPGPMLNAYDFGGYLIYEHIPTFVDGRTDIFLENNTFQDYMDLQNLAWDAPDLLDKYGFKSAILPPGYALSVYLTNSPDWHIAFRGANAEIFVRNDNT
ncbi:hypothetical protein [Alicyclobacillus fastidiosus]|uniref:Glycosyltransferase RgtA/B/C/D-like domain-containing protein n=1 Tax=Alicyclobacillus fastidiosus TaxID=392011 RepID=A0ABV5A9A1_9BACL|nr:hypothetical protein [Alicyclobacillus fastidiosus]WEH10791.1 hypothetical protein PYS47_06100 [Alicyclobacillus fastidiosus]